MSYEPVVKPKYELTDNYYVKFYGGVELFSKGDVLTLAGKELSTFSKTSPFHYKNDIIRLPNSILRKI